jgi:hypothetical protein
MEPLMVCKPVVEDSYHFGKDPDPHQSEKHRAVEAHNRAVDFL